MSLVRLCVNGWEIPDEKADLVKTIWPYFDKENKWRTLDDVLIEISEIPDWVADCSGMSIKPLKKIRFHKEPEKPLDFSTDTKEFLKTVNQIVMPGFELLQYGYIELVDDGCTDVIQKKLDQGFRIIAVLPQPSQRRPDYILVRKERP